MEEAVFLSNRILSLRPRAPPDDQKEDLTVDLPYPQNQDRDTRRRAFSSRCGKSSFASIFLQEEGSQQPVKAAPRTLIGPCRTDIFSRVTWWLLPAPRRNFGRAIAKRLANMRARLALWDINQEGVEGNCVNVPGKRASMRGPIESILASGATSRPLIMASRPISVRPSALSAMALFSALACSTRWIRLSGIEACCA